MALGRNKLNQWKKATEEAQRAQEALRAVLGGQQTSAQEARQKARELADALNSTYSISEFSSDGVVIRRPEWDAMEAVVAIAVRVIAVSGTPHFPKAMADLADAVRSLEALRGGEKEAIEGLLKLVESLET